MNNKTNQSASGARRSLFVLTSIGVMTALSVILTRFFPLIETSIVRLTLGGIPVILTSMVCGPFAGAVCGAVSDVIGCFLQGYPPYLPLILSPVIIGFFPGLVFSKLKKHEFFGKKPLLLTILAVFPSSFVASFIWTPISLYWLTGQGVWAIFGSRLLAESIQLVVNIILIYIIVKSKALERINRR